MLTLCNGLKHLGNDVDLFLETKRKGDLAETALTRFDLEPRTDLSLSVKSGPMDFVHDLKFLAASFESKDRPKIVHCHASHDHVLSALARLKTRLRATGAPVIVRHLHTDGAAKSSMLYYRLWKKTDGVVTASLQIAEQLKHNHGFPQDRILVLQNSVDPDLFTPNGPGRDEIRASLGLVDGDFLFGMVARFRPQRGHGDLVHAFYRRLKQVKRLHLVLVGRGEEHERIAGLCRELGLDDRVHLAGFVKQENLPEIYRAMDAALLMREGSDAGCRAVLEAMACGLPVIGTNRASMPALIDDGVTGMVVPGDDADEVARVMLEMFSSGKRAKEMGVAARNRVLSGFSQAGRAARCQDFYYSLLSNSQ
ncbi:MAG: glycosyltransferase [Deltaproteobacteria bacterium]|nr:glycosyltransferase [Deltaproteobacteria bacterium]